MDQPPLFGGEAGEPVPQVDPEDVKAAWASIIIRHRIYELEYLA
jgi:hypothetical protein